MEIITGTEDFYLEEPTAVAIGKFDGVHVGHRRLLEEILERRQRGLKACVFTFDPAPAVFFGVSDRMELTTREEKRQILELMGVDILIEFPMNRKTTGIPARSFVSELLTDRMNAAFIAAGRDVTFGAGGAGNAALLEEMAKENGYEVRLIDKVCMGGREVSSTYVRETVEKGEMDLVQHLLGIPYMIGGTVSHGRQFGRSLGMPTANLLPPAEKLLPPAGVYFSRVVLSGQRYSAITNIGKKPTVAGGEEPWGVETFIYDLREDISGAQIQVELHDFRRPERKFDSVGMLRDQMEQDLEAGRKYWKII
ncbi:MAG: riboflavin biosynthesis protein RibF [Lachnospiraceae bacterium]|nr:riboflavin biosynthesis protein RibF [Lachnospiraceae bacterium]